MDALVTSTVCETWPLSNRVVCAICACSSVWTPVRILPSSFLSCRRPPSWRSCCHVFSSAFFCVLVVRAAGTMCVQSCCLAASGAGSASFAFRMALLYRIDTGTYGGSRVAMVAPRGVSIRAWPGTRSVGGRGRTTGPSNGVHDRTSALRVARFVSGPSGLCPYFSAAGLRFLSTW